MDRIDGAKAAELTQKVGKHASGIQLKGPVPPEGATQKPEVMKTLALLPAGAVQKREVMKTLALFVTRRGCTEM